MPARTRLAQTATRARSHSKAFGYFIWTHDWLLALAVALCIILIGTAAGWSNNRLIPPFSKTHYHYVAEPNNPLSFLSNWDSPDYLGITQHGYTDLFDTNFFPLYPLLIRGVAVVVRSDLMSGLLIAWASLVGALYFLIQILKRLGKVTDQRQALQAVSFFVLFPTGVFLIAPYTESLYALMALGAIYFAMRRRLVISALLLLLCTACHVTGVFVAIWVALTLWEQRVRLRSIAAVFIVGNLGLISYMAYLQARFHDPLAFIHSQKQIHGWLQHSYLSLLTTADSLNKLFIILLLVTAVYYWRRGLKSFAVYTLLFLAIPLVGRQYGGFNRYVLMAFPLQFMLYEYFRNKSQVYPYVLAAMSVIWTYFTLQYAAGYIGS